MDEPKEIWVVEVWVLDRWMATSVWQSEWLAQVAKDRRFEDDGAKLRIRRYIPKEEA